MEQQNPYIKQFPDLFKGKTILYVHGFASSAASGSVTRIRQVLPSARVVAYDNPLHPQEAITMLNRVCAQEKPDLIIGISMGGMYTEMLYGYDRILLNPAFEMGDTMKEHGMIGAQRFLNPRQDGVMDFIVTKALVKEYKEITEHCFSKVTPEEQQRVHYPTAIRFHGEHSMNDHAFMHSVVPVIRWIDDRQEGRERKIIYIDISTMMDSWKKPLSSSQKTIRTLLESYQLHFVAKAPVDASYYADVNAWLYDYINVPAYGHTVFTNEKGLLYGDYLIDTEKTEGMATLIQLGTETFKTWDDIADYFLRLGGQ